jgi:dihydroflavonol-4-reductase
MPPGPVLVTGGSGYIAGHLIRRLVAAGWQVHTTLRSLAQEEALRAQLAVPAAQLRCFAAELRADAGWAEAVAGCRHVLHLASPLPAGVPRDADTLIVPARDGVLRVLRAARDAGVQRFVMTSSAAAVGYGRGRGVHHFTEADWTPDDYPGATPYIRSKTLAERAARAWVAAEGGALEFCSINPSVVLGPLWRAECPASLLIVKALLEGRLPGCPDLGFGVVDVRDVAELHLRALVAPGLAGERFIASGRFMKLREVAAVLRRELGADARRVPTRALPDRLVRLAALFSPVVRAVAGELGAERHQSAEHARQVLGWQTRPEAQSIADAARSLLALGLVRR